LKLQFAIEFSLNLREKREGNERKEEEEGELQFEIYTTTTKKIAD
jgi:hypothetical protein